MVNLGFTQQEIAWAQQIYNVEGRWIPKVAQQVLGNYYYQNAELVKECVKLLGDDTLKDAIQELSSGQIFDSIPEADIAIVAKHFEKMSRKYQRGSDKLFINNFSNFGINTMDTFAVCRNLNSPYDIYNEGRYVDGSDKYKLVKKTNKYAIIETKRHPFAQRESDLESDQASIELKEYTNDTYLVKINAEHVGILNRYAIVIALKPPITHCGCFCLMTSSGSVIYIYAIEFNNDLKFQKKIENRAGQWAGKTMIIGYGFDPKTLEMNLVKAVDYIKKQLDIRITIPVRPDEIFEKKINWLKEIPEDETSQDVDFEF